VCHVTHGAHIEHLQEVGCGVLDWIELAQVGDRWQALVNAVMNFQVP
jgi:aminoglycoside phosphotransferase (APT) family kinase protein